MLRVGCQNVKMLVTWGIYCTCVGAISSGTPHPHCAVHGARHGIVTGHHLDTPINMVSMMLPSSCAPPTRSEYVHRCNIRLEVLLRDQGMLPTRAMCWLEHERHRVYMHRTDVEARLDCTGAPACGLFHAESATRSSQARAPHTPCTCKSLPCISGNAGARAGPEAWGTNGVARRLHQTGSAGQSSGGRGRLRRGGRGCLIVPKGLRPPTPWGPGPPMPRRGRLPRQQPRLR